MERFSFSQELQSRTIAYYRTLGVELSPEIAREYLHEMAGLYEACMTFVSVPVQTSGRDLAESARRLSGAARVGAPAPDLISPHSCKSVV
ncbi:hypothetical protein BH11PAT2_BH11PAT2_05440 [soil metagenome]